MNANGAKFKTGTEMADIGEIKDGALIFDDYILWTGETSQAAAYIITNNIQIERTLDYSGKTILPGFVDSHTHIVFAGNRSEEFAKRLRGYSYQQIAAEGGGIIRTMNATREASVEELFENGKALALSALKHGTTAIEIKSGYGLSIESEIKQLKAIKRLNEEIPLHVSATFLGAHDFPPEYKNDRDKYVDLICNEMLPRVVSEGLAEYCDAFIDEGYFTIEQGEKIFESAKKLGLKIRVHADELANVEAAALSAKVGAVSSDHLLNISENGINELGKSGTIATLLPGTAYFIKMPFAPARKIIDSGVVTAIATDCNPGSCFTENMQMILSLSVINMKMTCEEALSASTINGAAALGKSDVIGSLEPGKFADFIVLDSSSYIDIFYHFGINHVKETWIKGRFIDF